jgi:serine phosphatase RsbU (regulator of sigma subunit)
MDFLNGNNIQEALVVQNEQLKCQLMATSLINEITKVMLASSDLDRVFQTIIFGIQETMGFERVVYFEVDRKNFCLKPKIWTGIKDDLIKKVDIPLGFMGGPTADAIFLNKHIIVDIVDKDIDPVAVLGSKAYLSIPLIAKTSKFCVEHFSCALADCPAFMGYNPYCWSIPGSCQRHEVTTEDERREACLGCELFKCVGVLWMDKPGSRDLVTGDQMTTLTTLAYQAGIIIDNFAMYQAVEDANGNLKEINDRLQVVNEDLSRAQARINKDLDHARGIQTGLLPDRFTDTQDMQVGARYIPAIQVGGDYYDFFRVDEDTFYLVVADVSGHGVAAAMIMAMVKVLLKTFSIQINSPQKSLETINKIFQTDIRTDNFVTIFYAKIDLKQQKIHYVSAGHNPIIYLDKGSKQYNLIKADGLFLGVFEDMMLQESSRDFKKGDRIVLYTDGLTEAENSNGDIYGLEHLCEISQHHSEKAPDAFIDTVFEDLKSFTQGKPLEDDVTMLVIDF